MQQASRHKMIIVTHSLFWLGYVILVSMLLTQLMPLPYALIRTLIMGVFHAILAYINLYILLPQYFEKGRFVQYGLLALGLVILTGILRMATDFGLSQFFQAYETLIFSRTHIAGMLVSGFTMILVTSSARMIDTWYQKQQLEDRLSSQQLEAELKFLKAQVNPHFLFNSLNNIYTLTLTQSEQAAPMILKLSEMMRYMLYECKSEWIPLASEIQYLHNFIELQELKTENQQEIHFEVMGDVSGIQVPPLLFAPLFENAFKHGNLEDTKTGWLRADLTITPDHLQLNIKNTFKSQARKDGVGGIGLENIRKRLELIYPNRHEWKAIAEEGVFTVEMKLFFD